MLKAIHAQKSKSVVEDLKAMKLKEAAKKLEDGIEEMLTYMMSTEQIMDLSRIFVGTMKMQK